LMPLLELHSHSWPSSCWKAIKPGRPAVPNFFLIQDQKSDMTKKEIPMNNLETFRKRR
jgi:hypothetical protein